jgi:hypothetical protein
VLGKLKQYVTELKSIGNMNIILIYDVKLGEGVGDFLVNDKNTYNYPNSIIAFTNKNNMVKVALL